MHARWARPLSEHVSGVSLHRRTDLEEALQALRMSLNRRTLNVTSMSVRLFKDIRVAGVAGVEPL
jgi:hypothetical protein